MLLVAAFQLPLLAQPGSGTKARVVDLAKTYQVDAVNGSAMVGSIYPGIQAITDRFPAWSAHWLAFGGDSASLQQASLISCAWNDAVLRAGKFLSAQGIAEVEFLLPPGAFRVDQPLLLMPGSFRGNGGTTTLEVDPANWNGQPGEAFLHFAPWGTSAMDGRTLRLENVECIAAAPVAGAFVPADGLRIEAPNGTIRLDRITVRNFRGTGIALMGASQTEARHMELQANGTGMALMGCTGQHRFVHITGNDNGERFRVGPWGAMASNCRIHGEDIALAAGRISGTRASADRLIVSDGPVNAEFDRVYLEVGRVVPTTLCQASNSTEGSFIRATNVHVQGDLRRLLRDATRARSYFRANAADPGTFGFCWTPGQPTGELPMDCGNAPEDNERSAQDDPGVAKSAEAPTIGEPTGGTMTNLAWGFNGSGLFSITHGNDTALHRIIGEMTPEVLRFPGGTLANFTHPTGLGYGMRASELATVEGTSVYNNVYAMYSDEQAEINAGIITRNYLQDVIDLALATNRKVLFVANLYSGTVQEMMTSLNNLANAGVQLVGVELGNESHLRAYDSRFGGHANYLAVAAPYAQAITNAYPDLPIGLNGYPPGVLKGLGPGGTQRAHDWNVAVSSAAFGDAVVIHCYSRPDSCNQASTLPNFACGADFSRVYAREKLDQALNELSAIGNRSIWITEWNIDGDYSHYGNSIAQSLFCADMAFTMAEHPKVTVSTMHNLLSMDAGYNVIKKIWQGYTPQINYYTSRLLAPLFRSGNAVQSCALNGVQGLRAMAFLAPDQQTQHLYVINRSGSAMNLAGFVGTALNVAVETLGGGDLAAGTGANAAIPNGNVSTTVQLVADIHDVQLPAYGIVHLSWATAPAGSAPIWTTSFTGQEDCRLVATTGTDVVQSNPGRCAVIGGGKLVTNPSSSFPASFQVGRIVLEGTTFQGTTTGKWLNARARFGTGGQIMDPVTGQVLATVQEGQYYPELVLDYTQPVALNSVIGKPNGGNATAAMTMKGMRLYSSAQ
ncbi:MAG: hypothetical protein JST45_04810 [Bacteroidetes bacterium]|nr:hypothetical protein [Bacteroidota bacterium]